MSPAHPHWPNLLRTLAILLGSAALLQPPLLGASPALGQEALISSFKAGVLKDENTANPTEADYATQAGSHPMVALTAFEMNSSLFPAVDDARVDLPPGLSVNPQATPKCEASGTTLESTCSKSERVGRATVHVSTLLGTLTGEGYVYNMVPPEGAPGDFAFEVTINAGLVVITVRTDLVAGLRWYPSGGRPADYGEYFTISGISNELGSKLVSSEMIFWGAPAEHNGGGGKNEAFLTNPTACAGPQTTYMWAKTYETGAEGSTSFTTPVGASGCNLVPFEPSLASSQSTTKRDSPDALTLSVHVPQNEEPSKIASSQLQEAQVTLPEGLSINPSAASGLQACSEAQFAAAEDKALSCPAASEVGSAEILSPVLGETLKGKLYIGEPRSANPESGEEYRLLLFAQDSADALALKLAGAVRADASTGRLSAYFSGLPPVPLSELRLSFKSGERALFANPLACGSASLESSLLPYSGNPAATPSASFSVDNNGAGEGCPTALPFAPKSSASLSSKQAGAATALTLDIAREDGEEDLSGLSLKLPEGLLANLNGVKLCEEAQASSGSCPAESKVGSASVTAGAGSEPLSLSGSVYMTGPYKGSPFGLAIVLPAIAGPYNLGTVVVRAAVGLSTVNGQLSITSDPLPQIVGGVPLRIRNVRIEINRSGFLVNPSSCGSAGVSGNATSTGGASSAIADPLSVEGCSSLAFGASLVPAPPTLALDSPFALTLGVDLAEGDAAARTATVTLPAGVSLNPAVGRGLEPCTEAELGVGTDNTITCPASSQVGSVTIKSPLLPGGLAGSLYVGAPLSANPESGEEYRLFLAASSSAYQLSVRLIGELKASAQSGQLKAVFTGLPPIPFTEMTLNVQGGKQPLFATPLACGTDSAEAALEPTSGGSPATPQATISVDANGAGGTCVSPPAFSPTSTLALSSKQAGASTALTLDIAREDGEEDLSGLSLKLPEGLLANLNGVKLCEEAQASSGSCPAESKVGSASVTAGAGSEPLSLTGSVYMTGPYKGSPFGLAIVLPAIAGPYNLGTVVVRAAVGLSTVNGQLSITSDPLPQIVGGVPLRLRDVKIEVDRSGFLVNPSSCSAPLPLVGSISSSGGQSAALGDELRLEGCTTLAFSPSFTVSPGQAAIDSPLPLEIALSLPSGDSTLHQATVALPEGVSINPSVASGLQACAEEQLHLGEDTPVACPSASSVGSVTITSPLLPEALTGSIYIGKPLSANPESGEEYRLFVAAESPTYAIALRMIGKLAANAGNGRLTATFDETPPIPFTEMKLSFDGGAHAPLASPTSCGSAQLSSSLLATDGASASPEAGITISANGEGEGCPASLPFAPTLRITPSTSAAGAFDALELAFESGDRQQKLGALETTLPPGLLGEIANVPLCGEPDAGLGSCEGASEIGKATAVVGVGSQPLELTGPVYLTGPYGGAPFGLSIAIPATAGPYNLGTVVVRAAISINPQNAQLTIRSSSFPTILGGIPLRLKGVRIALQRPSFIVNPTSCGSLPLSAKITSSSGTAAAASGGFQASGCQTLPFGPAVSASTRNPSTRTEGASLETVITYPSEGQANLASVGVTLPPQLVARTSTLSSACPEATFNANPAACPAAARVGTASVLTPLLPETLSGPAYLVSDGAEFPALDLVLGADGVQITLRGATAIHAGATSATFSDLPDVPIKRFALDLPAGAGSLLAANGDLCNASLPMPATLGAQSGAQLATQVNVAVAGCTPGAGGEGARTSSPSPLAHLTIVPARFAAKTRRAIRSAHRRGLKVGATITWSDAHASRTLFHIERLVAGLKRGRRCVAVTGTRKSLRMRARRHARHCTLAVRVVVKQTVHGVRHGRRCLPARSGAHGPRCSLHRKVAGFAHRDRAGRNSMPFSGLLGGHPLAPGAYLLVAEVPIPGTSRRARAAAKFWILRG